MPINLDHIDLATIDKSNIKIDVGLSIDAPHSANWLLTEPASLVIGVEPHPGNVETLRRGRTTPELDFPYLIMDENAICKQGLKIGTYDPSRFVLIEGAVDNVGNTPTTMDFYCTAATNSGCSSLLKPTPMLPHKIESKIKVDVYSLEYILDQLGFQDVEGIRFVKTDTQGKDFDVVKSLGKYLPRVLALKCEHNVEDQYESSNSFEEFQEYMTQNGFQLVYNNGWDAHFFNLRYRITGGSPFNLPSGI
tara:strand:- start:2089 stop:2835 length:747 start_codon:yes stop_codon:yes gene_type:complete